MFFYWNFHQNIFSNAFRLETWSIIKILLVSHDLLPAFHSSRDFPHYKKRRLPPNTIGLLAHGSHMATNQQDDCFHAPRFTDEVCLSTELHGRSWIWAMCIHQSYSVIQQENMLGSTSHFQLALLESSSDSMLIRLFSPVDFVMSQFERAKITTTTTKDPPHPLSKMDNPARPRMTGTRPPQSATQRLPLSLIGNLLTFTRKHQT